MYAKNRRVRAGCATADRLRRPIARRCEPPPRCAPQSQRRCNPPGGGGGLTPYPVDLPTSPLFGFRTPKEAPHSLTQRVVDDCWAIRPHRRPEAGPVSQCPPPKKAPAVFV